MFLHARLLCTCKRRSLFVVQICILGDIAASSIRAKGASVQLIRAFSLIYSYAAPCLDSECLTQCLRIYGNRDGRDLLHVSLIESQLRLKTSKSAVLVTSTYFFLNIVNLAYLH